MARSGSRRPSKRRASTSKAMRLVAAAQFLLVGQRAIEPAAQLREPIGVTVESSSANSVAESWPDSETSISRLRRVAASSCSASPRSSTASARDVRQRGLLRLAHVLQQRAGGGDRQRQIVGAEAAQVERAELVREQARGARRARSARAGARAARRAVISCADLARLVFGDQQLRGLQALELGFERGVAVGLEHREAPGGEIEPGEAEDRASCRRGATPRLAGFRGAARAARRRSPCPA